MGRIIVLYRYDGRRDPHDSRCCCKCCMNSARSSVSVSVSRLQLFGLSYLLVQGAYRCQETLGGVAPVNNKQVDYAFRKYSHPTQLAITNQAVVGINRGKTYL